MWLDCQRIRQTFFSQISLLTAWDMLLLQECFRKFGGGAERTGGGTAMPSSHRTSAMERTSESCWGSERMDCMQSSWVDRVEYYSGPAAPQRQKVGRVRDGLGGNLGFVLRRLGQPLILGGDFNARFYGLTDFRHAKNSIPRPRTLTGTNHTLRAGERHTVVAELDLTVTNTWMTRKLRIGTVHTKQLDGTRGRIDANGLHHDIEETGSKTNAMDFDWFKTETCPFLHPWDTVSARYAHQTERNCSRFCSVPSENRQGDTFIISTHPVVPSLHCCIRNFIIVFFFIFFCVFFCLCEMFLCVPSPTTKKHFMTLLVQNSLPTLLCTAERFHDLVLYVT